MTLGWGQEQLSGWKLCCTCHANQRAEASRGTRWEAGSHSLQARPWQAGMVFALNSMHKAESLGGEGEETLGCRGDASWKVHAKDWSHGAGSPEHWPGRTVIPSTCFAPEDTMVQGAGAALRAVLHQPGQVWPGSSISPCPHHDWLSPVQACSAIWHEMRGHFSTYCIQLA